MGDAATGFTFDFFVEHPHDRLPWSCCIFPESCQCFGKLLSVDLAPLHNSPEILATGQRSGVAGSVSKKAENVKKCLPCCSHGDADCWNVMTANHRRGCRQR